MQSIIFNYAGMVTKGMKNKEAEFWVANAIQALMFGIMHANWIQGSFAFVIGLGLGWMRRRYNSLYPSMLAHLTVNFLSSFVMGYVFLDPTGESFQWFSAGHPGLRGSQAWQPGSVAWHRFRRKRRRSRKLPSYCLLIIFREV